MVSLLVATPPEEILKHLGITAERYYAHLLDRGCTFYILGSRGLFYGILLFAWFVNALFFIALVVTITFLLAKYREFTRFQEV